MVSVRKPELIDPTTGRPFSPSAPPPAVLAAGTPPRGMFPPVGANLNRTPRAGWEVTLASFCILRAFANEEPLCQIARADVKGQILGMEWEVVPDEGEDAERFEKEIAAVKAWMRMPDPLARLKFKSWMSKCLEELLVTDALTLYPRRKRSGEFIGLEQIDGATIIPLVDDRGRYPLPPSQGGDADGWAFEQVKNGIVETQFYLDELWYRPRNLRPDTPYGMPPVEMILLILNITMRQGMYDLSWFTEGTIPEGLFSLPEDWSAAQVLEYQGYFDADLTRMGEKRAAYLKFVPPGSYHELKARQFSLDEKEWYARQVCHAFGISPMPLLKQINRATSETMEESTLESGVRPVAEFMGEILTDAAAILTDGAPLIVRPKRDEVEDPSVVYQRNVAYAGRGALTIGELVEAAGSDAVDPELASERVIDTPSGPMFLSELIEQREARRLARQRAIENPPPQPGGQPGGEDASAGQDTRGAEPTDTSTSSEAEDDQAAAKDLARWLTFVRKRVKEGRPIRKFVSDAIPARTRRLVEVGLVRAGASPERVTRLFELARLGKAEMGIPASAENAEAAIRSLLAGWLEANRDRLIATAVEQLPAEKLAKDDEAVRPLVPDVDMSDLIPQLEAALADAAGAGSSDTAAIISYSLDNTPEQALAYARARAAELVGMRYTASGDLIENPDKRFAITETIREDIRNRVAAAIENGWSPQELTGELQTTLGPARAETVSRTETGFAYNEGAADVYEEAGQEYVEVLDGAGCLPVGHNDAAVKPSGARGVVETEAQANGQIWTVAQMRLYRLGHPNCVRGFAPV